MLKHVLSFGLYTQELLHPSFAILRARLFIYRAPSCTQHLHRKAPSRSKPPGQQSWLEVWDGYNAPILVPSDELAVDELALDLVLQPRQALLCERLRRSAKVPRLDSSQALDEQ